MEQEDITLYAIYEKDNALVIVISILIAVEVITAVTIILIYLKKKRKQKVKSNFINERVNEINKNLTK